MFGSTFLTAATCSWPRFPAAIPAIPALSKPGVGALDLNDPGGRIGAGGGTARLPRPAIAMLTAGGDTDRDGPDRSTAPGSRPPVTGFSSGSEAFSVAVAELVLGVLPPLPGAGAADWG